ncbi:hypothetical protein CANCADRAFT_24324 [Tortispora caseinolytica NRRL Y-17796]|uniref:Ribosomal protein/NADH dehydrogenase domain-containing protein n=1 Tax=Tortispora caseinolytica NRRL Y-17796 TaxID=767744 RepID=A0A1E4TG23_9ASCO|nr:hypothetical protein CANCADRAFT_24324 [Tortispora caseinolytica NRRL Y-17796]
MSTSMFKGLPTTRNGRQIARLNALVSGPGALKTPDNLRAMKLIFKLDNKYGHMGARKFWRTHAPVIQYHNPNLQILVTRIETNTDEEAIKVPAKMVLEYDESSGMKPVEIDIKSKMSDEILELFRSAAKATEVPAEDIPVFTTQKNQK